MIKVWHKIEPTFDEDLEKIAKAWRSGGYECVAEVGTPAEGHTEQEWAFYRTNSIDHVWTENGDVKPIRKHIRSTFVGDIVECSNGHLLICDWAGWKELPTGIPSDYPDGYR